jgi:glycosyltransferase involved in cell wall biosynthesis
VKNKRFAFFRVYGNVPVGFTVEEMLRKAFPEYELDMYEVTALLKKSPGVIARNGMEMLRLYGKNILQGHKSVRYAFWGTPYLFRRCQSLVQEAIAAQGRTYAFTFQLQSLVNANPGGAPHFVYMDHTHLANLAYEGYDKRRLFNKAWIAEEKALYQSAAFVFTRSSNISCSLMEDYGVPSEQVACVYVGVNVAPGKGLDNGRYHHKNILFVGADWERKGGPQLIEAFQQVRQQMPEARLTIVGATPNLAVENCEVVGPVPVEQMGQYFDAATLFCMPTRREPFGVAFIEAMSHHLPVVATNVGAIPDFVLDGKNGYLIELDDAAALKDSLLKLLQDPQRCETFGQYGYELYAARYNWDEVGQAMRKHVLAVL